MTMPNIDLHSVLFPVGVAFTAVLVLLGIRLAAGAATRAPEKVLVKRLLSTILVLAMAGSTWAGYVVTAPKSDTGDADPGPDPLVATAAATEEKDEPLKAVNLTKMQIDAFLADYSLLFDNRSLVSKSQVRLDLLKDYGQNFQGAVYVPMSKILDKLDQINSGALKDEELEALYKEVRHDIYQSIVANPVVLDMWLQLLSSMSKATENNGWVTEYMKVFDDAFARTDDPQGLDCFLEYVSGSKDIAVTRECAEMAVHVCYILEQMDIAGLTKRSSSRNWELPIIDEETGNVINDEDSRTRTRESKTQEAELALLFTYVNKGGKEILAFGVNLFDQRAELFPTNVKEPPVDNTPTTPTNTPPKEDPPPKEEPKSYNLTIKYLETGTERVLFDQFGPKSYKQGADYSVTSPQKAGYTCSLPTVAGKMPAQNVTVTVWYTPIPQEKSNDHTLKVEYYLEDGSAVLTDKWVTTVLATGTPYSYNSPELKGYTPDRAVVSGTMPDSDKVEKVVYYRNSYELRIHYKDKATQETLARDYVGTYKYQEYYEVKSPEIAGYTCETPYVYGYMPDNNVEVTVWYVKEATYELRIHYKESGSGKTLADDFVGNYKVGTPYSVTSPVIKGYVCETPVVSGTMPARNVEVTVWYTKETSDEHTLTIYYEFLGGGRAAPTYTGTYKKGQSYSVTSPSVSGWTPVTSVVFGTMGDEDLVFTVYYTKDGNGTNKDPNADPGPQGNAPEKGGTNDTTQGEGGTQGKPQDEKPGSHDYGNGDQSTGQDRNDLDQNGNSTIPNVPGQGDDESSGTGGVDHPQQDAEGGYGEGLDIPDKDPIPEHNDNDAGTGGNNGWAGDEIDEPPV